MKQFIAVMLIALAFAGALTLPASSQTADSLDAVVTPFGVAISINETEVDFGTMPLSRANDDRETKESAAITVNNDGSAPANLLIEGSDATPDIQGEATWILDCLIPNGLVGANQFVLRYAFGGSPDFAATGQPLCEGSTKSLATGVLGGNSAMFVLEMNMPTATDGFSTRTTTVTVTAVQAP